MHGFVGALFGFVILVLILLGVLGAGILKSVRGRDQARGGQMEAEEAKLIQELHQGLARMEERIEALETILLEREKEARK